MGAHRGKRIDQPRPLLDHKPLYRIRVIGTPDLGAVIEHARIKPSSSAGTVLKKQFGKFSHKPLLQFIYPQYIAVKQFPMMRRIQTGAAQIGKKPVHIPLHIADIGTAQYFCHRLIHIIHHFRPGEIQHILITPHGSLPLIYLQCPVGMRPV